MANKTNNKRRNDDQGHNTYRDKQEIGISASKFDIRARPFRYHRLFHFLLTLFPFVNALLSLIARRLGRASTVWAHAHMLHTTAHLAFIPLGLLLCTLRSFYSFRLRLSSASRRRPADLPPVALPSVPA